MTPSLRRALLPHNQLPQRPDLQYCHMQQDKPTYGRADGWGPAGTRGGTACSAVLRDLGQVVLIHAVQCTQGVCTLLKLEPPSNSESQKKRRSQLASVSFNGKVPADWSSTATLVQISKAINTYKKSVAKAAGIKAGSPEWDALPKYARIGNLTCHPGSATVAELHWDVSSVAAEIYAASVALRQLLHMSYVCDEMWQNFEMSIRIGVDTATVITCAAGTVKMSKPRHINSKAGLGTSTALELTKPVKVDRRDPRRSPGAYPRPGHLHAAFGAVW